MTPTLTAPDAVIPEDVRRFAAERGVTDYLIPLFEIASRCFAGADVTVRREDDPEIPDLSWIVYEAAVGNWTLERIEASYDAWTTAFIESCPADARASFSLGMR